MSSHRRKKGSKVEIPERALGRHFSKNLKETDLECCFSKGSLVEKFRNLAKVESFETGQTNLFQQLAQDSHPFDVLAFRFLMSFTRATVPTWVQNRHMSCSFRLKSRFDTITCQKHIDRRRPPGGMKPLRVQMTPNAPLTFSLFFS